MDLSRDMSHDASHDVTDGSSSPLIIHLLMESGELKGERGNVKCTMDTYGSHL